LGFLLLFTQENLEIDDAGHLFLRLILEILEIDDAGQQFLSFSAPAEGEICGCHHRFLRFLKEIYGLHHRFLTFLRFVRANGA
jgi:hypothetical protein